MCVCECVCVYADSVNLRCVRENVYFVQFDRTVGSYVLHKYRPKLDHQNLHKQKTVYLIASKGSMNVHYFDKIRPPVDTISKQAKVS